MHSSLSPVHEPSPSSTANTGGLPSVHCLHKARMADSLVGSMFTIMGRILRPLMPPASLMAFTKVWMAAFWTPNSVSPENPKLEANDVRLEIGKTTLMEVAFTPRVLVDAWSTPMPLGLPSPRPLEAPGAPEVPFFDDVPAIP